MERPPLAPAALARRGADRAGDRGGRRRDGSVDHAPDRGDGRRARCACRAPSRSARTTTTARWPRGCERLGGELLVRGARPERRFREQPAEGVTDADKIGPRTAASTRRSTPSRSSGGCARSTRTSAAFIEEPRRERLGVRRAAVADAFRGCGGARRSDGGRLLFGTATARSSCSRSCRPARARWRQRPTCAATAHAVTGARAARRRHGPVRPRGAPGLRRGRLRRPRVPCRGRAGAARPRAIAHSRSSSPTAPCSGVRTLDHVIRSSARGRRTSSTRRSATRCGSASSSCSSSTAWPTTPRCPRRVELAQGRRGGGTRLANAVLRRAQREGAALAGGLVRRDAGRRCA